MRRKPLCDICLTSFPTGYEVGYELVEDRRLKQAQAASLLGGTNSQFSALLRCSAVAPSVERPMRFLTIPGQDVELAIRPKAPRRDRAQLSVIVPLSSGSA